MSKRLVISHGSYSGHWKEGGNNQDASYLLKFYNERTIVVAVADGMGSGAHSEVGALLAVEFVCHEWLSYHAMNADEIANTCQWVYRSYLNWLADTFFFRSAKHRIQFVSDYLMHTIHVLLIVDGHAYTFHKGDGYIVCDDSVTKLDADNDEHGDVIYPALYLITTGELRERARRPWQMYDWGTDWQRIGIATDGLRFAIDAGLLDSLMFSDDIQNALHFAIREDRTLKNGDDITMVGAYWTDDHE